MTDKLLALTLPGSGPISLPSQINNVSILGVGFGSIIIMWAINLALVLAIIATLVYILWAGWKWITSQGDPKTIETARNMILFGALGLGMVVLSMFLVNIAASFLCVPLLGWTPSNCH